MSIQVRGLAPLLQIFDMPTSLAFYVDVLGCRIVNASGPVPHCGWAHLALGDTELMLNTMYEDHDRPSEIDSDRAVAHGDTALYFGCPDVEAVHRHLLEKGLDCGPPVVTSYGMKQLSVKDPDGYNLCFQWASEIEKPNT